MIQDSPTLWRVIPYLMFCLSLVVSIISLYLPVYHLLSHISPCIYLWKARIILFTLIKEPWSALLTSVTKATGAHNRSSLRAVRISLQYAASGWKSSRIVGGYSWPLCNIDYIIQFHCLQNKLKGEKCSCNISLITLWISFLMKYIAVRERGGAMWTCLRISLLWFWFGS